MEDVIFYCRNTRRRCATCDWLFWWRYSIEQVNLGQRTNLSREFEREHMAALIRAPHECLSFYAATQAGHPPFEVQIDAMMIALAQHLPTVNGWSGLFPPGWNFYDTNAGEYEQRATRWAVKRGFVGNLCQVNVESGTWTLATQGRDLICASRSCPISFGQSHEFQIYLQRGGNSAPFEDDGWVGPEPWGQWTGAAQAALSFTVWPHVALVSRCRFALWCPPTRRSNQFGSRRTNVRSAT